MQAIDDELDQTGFSTELAFLLDLMIKKSDMPSGFAIHNMDWNQFIQLAVHHRVHPIVYSHAKSLPQPILPESVTKTLQMLYQQNIIQMLQFSSEMESVGRVFAERNVRLLFLKGPGLARDLYGDLSLRSSCDLDALVSLDELDNAEKLLFDMGYVKDEYIDSVLNDWKWRHHHFAYIHPKKHIKFELHWRLNPGPSANNLDFEELWQRRRNSDLGSTRTFQLCFEDLMLFLIQHGARHGWSRARWLQDIVQLLNMKLNWTMVLQLSRRYRITHVLGQAVILASQVLDASIPDQLQHLKRNPRSRRLAAGALFYIERIINLHNPPLPPEVDRYHKRHLFQLMSFSQKILFILSFLYPYSEDAKALPLPKLMHFMYFPLRPFIWAYRKIRGEALL